MEEVEEGEIVSNPPTPIPHRRASSEEEEEEERNSESRGFERLVRSQTPEKRELGRGKKSQSEAPQSSQGHTEETIDRVIAEAEQIVDVEALRQQILADMLKNKLKKAVTRSQSPDVAVNGNGGSRESGEVSENDIQDGGTIDAIIPPDSQIKERISFGIRSKEMRGVQKKSKESDRHTTRRQVATYKYYPLDKAAYPPKANRAHKPRSFLDPKPQSHISTNRRDRSTSPSPRVTTKKGRWVRIETVIGNEEEPTSNSVANTFNQPPLGLLLPAPGLVDPIELMEKRTALTRSNQDNYDEVPMDTATTPPAEVALDDLLTMSELVDIDESSPNGGEQIHQSQRSHQAQSVQQTPRRVQKIRSPSPITAREPDTPQAEKRQQPKQLLASTKSIDERENEAKLRLEMIDATLKKKMAEADKCLQERRELLTFVAMKSQVFAKLQGECNRLVNESQAVKQELFELKAQLFQERCRVEEVNIDEDETTLREMQVEMDNLRRQLEELEKDQTMLPSANATTRGGATVKRVQIEMNEEGEMAQSTVVQQALSQKMDEVATLPPPPIPPTLVQEPKAMKAAAAMKRMKTPKTSPILFEVVPPPQQPFVTQPEPESEIVEFIPEIASPDPEPEELAPLESESLSRRRSSSLDEETLRKKLLEKFTAKTAVNAQNKENEIASLSLKPHMESSPQSPDPELNSEEAEQGERSDNSEPLDDSLMFMDDECERPLDSLDDILNLDGQAQLDPTWERGSPTQHAPLDVVCPFQLLGICKNDQCNFVHLRPNPTSAGAFSFPPATEIPRVSHDADPNAQLYDSRRTYSRFDFIMKNED